MSSFSDLSSKSKNTENKESPKSTRSSSPTTTLESLSYDYPDSFSSQDDSNMVSVPTIPVSKFKLPFILKPLTIVDPYEQMSILDLIDLYYHNDSNIKINDIPIEEFAKNCYQILQSEQSNPNCLDLQNNKPESMPVSPEDNLILEQFKTDIIDKPSEEPKEPEESEKPEESKENQPPSIFKKKIKKESDPMYQELFFNYEKIGNVYNILPEPQKFEYRMLTTYFANTEKKDFFYKVYKIGKSEKYAYLSVIREIVLHQYALYLKNEICKSDIYIPTILNVIQYSKDENVYLILKTEYIDIITQINKIGDQVIHKLYNI
jgi:hypothetical protein